MSEPASAKRTQLIAIWRHYLPYILDSSESCSQTIMFAFLSLLFLTNNLVHAANPSFLQESTQQTLQLDDIKVPVVSTFQYPPNESILTVHPLQDAGSYEQSVSRFSLNIHPLTKARRMSGRLTLRKHLWFCAQKGRWQSWLEAGVHCSVGSFPRVSDAVFLIWD